MCQITGIQVLDINYHNWGKFVNFLTSTPMMSLEVGCNLKYHYQVRVVDFLTITPTNYREVGIQNLNQLPLGLMALRNSPW